MQLKGDSAYQYVLWYGETKPIQDLCANFKEYLTPTINGETLDEEKF